MGIGTDGRGDRVSADRDRRTALRGGGAQLTEESYHGIPRRSIAWYPRVDPERCTRCGNCVEFCHQGVYVMEDMPKVTNPYRCVVGCTGCVDKCPEHAISFPSMKELAAELRRLKRARN